MTEAWPSGLTIAASWDEEAAFESQRESVDSELGRARGPRVVSQGVGSRHGQGVLRQGFESPARARTERGKGAPEARTGPDFSGARRCTATPIHTHFKEWPEFRVPLW